MGGLWSKKCQSSLNHKLHIHSSEIPKQIVTQKKVCLAWLVLTQIPFADECLVDNDCPVSKACKNKNCVDPCLSTICGDRALCKVEFHSAICYCPSGLQGNAHISCIEVGCRSNDDCGDREKCDYLPGSNQRKECQPLCTRSPCAQDATCSASNHREICTCNHPLQGDGYSTCYARKNPKQPFKSIPLPHNLKMLLNALSFPPHSRGCWKARMLHRLWLSILACMHWKDLPESLFSEQPLQGWAEMRGHRQPAVQISCMRLSWGLLCWQQWGMLERYLSVISAPTSDQRLQIVRVNQ